MRFKFLKIVDIINCPTCRQVTHVSLITNGGCAMFIDEAGWHRGCQTLMSEDVKDALEKIDRTKMRWR